MDKMEKKLAEYRARKAREAKITQLNTKMKNFLSGFQKSPEPNPAAEALVPPEDCEESPPEDASSVCSDEDTITCCTLMDFLYYSLWFVLWAILYWIFIEFQFGTVFLIISGIVFMFVNTRTKTKHGEISAYSVFNKNCESIDGTLKAEQFEREIRYGSSAVK